MLRLPGQNTATYCAVINENGELSLGLGDMEVHQQITEQYVSGNNNLTHRLFNKENNRLFHSFCFIF